MTYAPTSPPLVFQGESAQQTAVPWPLLVLLTFWGWTIWGCADYWRGNPNYSYGWSVPLLVAGFALRRFFIADSSKFGDRTSGQTLNASGVFLLVIGAAAVFLLEYAREQVLHPTIVIWSMALITVVSTLAVFFLVGGRQLVRAQAFPICLFLTAIPWPPRLEQPVTTTLMRWMALTTAELLHWLGIEANAAGGAIAVPGGLVGITEACSGIRSLQAGVMFGLAMGEWFLLSAARRVVLLALAIILALISNVGRTLALTLQANEHGVQSVDQVHDLVGNIAITALILAIWLAGRLLARPAIASASFSFRGKIIDLVHAILRPGSTLYLAAFVSLLLGLLTARAAVVGIEAKDKTQTSPFFTVIKTDAAANHAGTIPAPVWTELHPTSGEYIHHQDPALGAGGADCFHFFWKPSPWNRFALVHRPDICMPGVGWQLDAPATSAATEFNGHTTRFYVFRFHRGATQALELWGAWRNGEAVPINYRPDQVLGSAAPPATLHLEGKRHSATEIVSCSIIAESREPSVETALKVLHSVFDYNPR